MINRISGIGTAYKSNRNNTTNIANNKANVSFGINIGEGARALISQMPELSEAAEIVEKAGRNDITLDVTHSPERYISLRSEKTKNKLVPLSPEVTISQVVIRLKELIFGGPDAIIEAEKTICTG